jgi:hypothetical protein
MAPASCKALIAQPRKVRVVGRRSFVINISDRSIWTNPFVLDSFRLLAQGRDSELRWLELFHVFRRAVHNKELPAGLPAGFEGVARGQRLFQNCCGRRTAAKD